MVMGWISVLGNTNRADLQRKKWYRLHNLYSESNIFHLSKIHIDISFFD